MRRVWVWDIAVRLGHWLLVICFATAYATGDGESWRLWHVYSGNGVLGILCFRVLWGFIGTPHPRFSTFMLSPAAALHYLKNLFSGKPVHTVGHNPAGGWAIIGLLGLSAVSAISGWLIYEGILPRWLEKTHELAANATLLLVVVHVLAVIVSSRLHHDNLIKAMIIGYKFLPQSQAVKKSEQKQPFSSKITRFGVFLLISMFGLAIKLLA